MGVEAPGNDEWGFVSSVGMGGVFSTFAGEL